MTIEALMSAVQPALTEMFGADWTVNVTDDEWSAYGLLGGKPGGVRAIFLPEEFTSETGPALPYRGAMGELRGRLIVQIKRGMGRDESVPLNTLFVAEETARRALFALTFQVPGDPAWPAEWQQPGRPPHGELGFFVHRGSGAYKPPAPELALEHPAREVRWGLAMALRVPNNVRRVDIPLSAGN